MAIEVNIADIYDRISAGPGRRAARARAGSTSSSSSLLAILFLIIEFAALVMGLVLARVDHGLGPRAVHGHRAGPAGRLRPPDRGRRARPARRAGGVVQPDDGQHRGPAAAGRGEAAARGGAAHRAGDPDVAAAAGASCRSRASPITALCVPAREVGGDYYDFLPLGDRRLRRAHRRRVGQGHVGGVLHGRAEGADAVAQPDPPIAARAAHQRQPDHLRSPRQPQLHHDDLRGHRSRARGR